MLGVKRAVEPFEQGLNQGLPSRGAPIIDLVLQGIGVAAKFLLNAVENAGFESAVAKIEPGGLHFGKTKGAGVAQFREPVHHGPAGVGKPKSFGSFIEGLAHGIVKGSAQKHKIKSGPHVKKLGVTARND